VAWIARQGNPPKPLAEQAAFFISELNGPLTPDLSLSVSASPGDQFTQGREKW
jgi:hypothetical protein